MTSLKTKRSFGGFIRNQTPLVAYLSMNTYVISNIKCLKYLNIDQEGFHKFGL